MSVWPVRAQWTRAARNLDGRPRALILQAWRSNHISLERND